MTKKSRTPPAELDETMLDKAVGGTAGSGPSTGKRLQDPPVAGRQASFGDQPGLSGGDMITK